MRHEVFTKVIDPTNCPPLPFFLVGKKCTDSMGGAEREWRRGSKVLSQRLSIFREKLTLATYSEDSSVWNTAADQVNGVEE